MHITIDTNNLSDVDKAMLMALVGVPAAPKTPAPAPATKAPAKATPTKAAAAPVKPAEAEAEPEQAEDDDLVGTTGPTLSDAIAMATELISSGQTAKVKAALAEVGAKRVSEVTEKSVAKFVAALQQG